MANEPFVDPPRPPSEEQKRMLLEVGRDYHMHGTQRYESETQRYAGPVVYSEGGLLSGRSSKTSTQYPLTVMGLTRSHSNPTAAYMGQGLEPSQPTR